MLIFIKPMNNQTVKITIGFFELLFKGGVIKSGRKELKGLRGAKIKGKSSEQGVWFNDETINR